MSKFNFIATEIPGVIIIEPTVFGDSRGYFMETYQAEEFAAAGIPGPFVQDNQSKSTRGVLRGLHFQKWDDPDVGIVWPAVDGEIRLSAKDGEHRGFKEQTYEFFERW